MKISERGRNLIQSFEQCRLDAYMPTPDDVPTIGWGHTGMDVQMGLRWTQEQADDAFERDIAKYEDCVTGCMRHPLTQSEFDACVSLCFNIGRGAFQQSTLVRKLNAQDFPAAAEEFLRWDKQAGKVLAGLTRRRKAEKELFEDFA